MVEIAISPETWHTIVLTMDFSSLPSMHMPTPPFPTLEKVCPRLQNQSNQHWCKSPCMQGFVLPHFRTDVNHHIDTTELDGFWTKKEQASVPFSSTSCAHHSQLIRLMIFSMRTVTYFHRPSAMLALPNAVASFPELFPQPYFAIQFDQGQQPHHV